MTAHRAALDGGWAGFQAGNSADAAATGPTFRTSGFGFTVD
jgi:hypothetical protein